MNHGRSLGYARGKEKNAFVVCSGLVTSQLPIRKKSSISSRDLLLFPEESKNHSDGDSLELACNHHRMSAVKAFQHNKESNRDNDVAETLKYINLSE